MFSPNRNTLRVIVLFGLLLLPIIYALFTAIDLEYSFLKKGAYLAVVILMLLIPAVFLKARTYFIVEGVFNFFFFPIDIASLYLNRQSTSTAFLENIIHTDFHESIELLVSMWPICVVVIALWVLYFWLAIRVENRYLLPPIIRNIVLISIPVTFMMGMLCMTLILTQVYKERPLGSTLTDAVDMMWMKLYKIYPYNLYIETSDIIRATQHQRNLQKQVDDFYFGIQSMPKDSAALYVLVIGETARYDHFSINGYNRPTSPLLAFTRNLISYDSAYSQANLTRPSIPLILTRATADCPEKAYSEKSLPEAFQEAGFQVGFISKQIPIGIIPRIMSACDYSHDYAKGIDVLNNYDEDMINEMRKWNNDTLQFFVLHSLGCHFRYELRYPSEFAVFQPTFGNSFNYSMITEENKEQLVNAYDNAILYTDYFLSQLIAYMDSLDRPAIMLYMSDHGESFWDDERKLSLHGSYQISEYEYHVPLLVWYSDEYKANYPEKVKTMLQNKTTPVSSDVVFYSLLDAAGIDDIVDSTRSICSPYLEAQDTITIITGSGSTERWAIPRPSNP